VRREIKALKAELERLRGLPDRIGPSYEELKIIERLLEHNHKEEVMWRQRARIQWLAEGDKNTHFLYIRASKRKKRNHIVKLKRADGVMTEDTQELSTMAQDFYKNLYTTEGTIGSLRS
jgi:hypothetical protein